MGGRKCLYTVIALLLFALPVKAEMPPQLDSLRDLVRVRTGISSTNAFVSDEVLRDFVNIAIQQVCDDFDAYARIDTVTLLKDSTGAVLNSDFLRVRWVQKLIGDTMWVPMGEVGADTLYLQIVDTSDAKLKKLVAVQPRLFMWHGKLFTHPKYNKGTIAQTFLVAYWASDTWQTTGSSETNVRAQYRNAIIDYASYLVSGRRGDATREQAYLQAYKGHLGK